MNVLPPQRPRLAAELEPWNGETRGEVEIDDCIVKQVNFMNVQQLYVGTSQLEGVLLTGAALEKIEVTDTVCKRSEGAALQTYRSNMLRTELEDCRLTGAEFAEGKFEDCIFKNVKLDEAGFRFANFKRVRFENCMLRGTDFTGANFAHVVLIGCDLEGTNFADAKCRNMDVSSEDLTLTKGLLGLKGVTISAEQLMQLAPLLASELGFHVKD